MEKDAELKGKIQIMVLNEDGTRFVKNKKITELKPGMEFTIQADAEVLFSPEPPSTLLWKTGDFTADLYLRDSSKKTGKRLYFTMKRNAGGPTENKTCTIEFPSNIDPAKWGDVFYLPQGEGAFEHKYMSPLIISGAELNPVPPPPPRKLKAR